MWDDLVLFVAIGFAAQLVDGALGMAYGITATSTLLSFGIPPSVASASVHAAEVFTTGASGAAHWHLGNVRKDLMLRLAIPGAIGGGVGAYVLSAIPGDQIRPFINVYLVGMGVYILWKALRRPQIRDHAPKHIVPLGAAGGFVDAIGGGGWGPIVATTLIGGGTLPRHAIGSVNLAEFFVTATITATFIATIGLELWPIITGLVLGGILAAPFAAYVTRQVPDKPLMILVGIVTILLSIRGLIQALG